MKATSVRGLLPLLLFLAAWQLLGTEGSPYFPPPSEWGPALMDLWDNGQLRPAVIATLATFSLALGVATVLGALLGFLVGTWEGADRALGPTFEFFRAMPPAAMVPVATLLIGYNEQMKVTVVTIAAVWSIMLNTRAGVRRLDPLLLDTAASLHLNRLDRIGKVVFPALLPSIFLGVRVAAPIALVITLLVEILTQVPGVGGLIATSQRTFQSDQVYGLIVVAGIISLAINMLVVALEAYTFRHRPGR